MIRSLVSMMRVIDRRVIYCFMALIVPFYMLFSHKGYLASYRFYRLRMGYGPVKAFLNVYGNHFRFGQVIIDRYAAFAGKRFNFTVDGNELFMDLSSRPGGFVQLSSHVGNFEMTGYGLDSTAKHVNGLAFAGESKVMMEFRSRILAEHNVGLIVAGEGGMEHIFQMNSAIDRGEIVSMTGDRLFGSQKSVTCDFMGSGARFPMGPFVLAAQKEVPLLALFAMRERGGSYRVICRKVDSDVQTLSVRAKAESLARAFARELESVVREYPLQWFNWYDFWKQGA